MNVSELHPVRLIVNGQPYERQVEPRLLLCDFLRHELNLTGTHVGCEHGVCGACTVQFEGQAVRSCLMLAVQADGHEITTIEGLGHLWEQGHPRVQESPGESPDEVTGGYQMHPLQRGFWEAHGLQCGFCTPGFLMTLGPFLEINPNPSEEEIREAISGVLCRCTGYQHIVDAVLLAAKYLQNEG